MASTYGPTSRIVDSIAQAIARQEGYSPGNLAYTNNNPGNLRSWGSTPTVNGFAKFPSPQAGWDALKYQVALNINRGLTLEEFFGGKSGVYAGYSPAADSNRPDIYARNVSEWAGVPLGVPLNQVDPETLMVGVGTGAGNGSGDGGGDVSGSSNEFLTTDVDPTKLAILGIGAVALVLALTR